MNLIIDEPYYVMYIHGVSNIPKNIPCDFHYVNKGLASVIHVFVHPEVLV